MPAHLQQYTDDAPSIGVRMPILKLRNTASKQKGVKVGEYFIAHKVDSDADAEIINLGSEVEVVILRHAITAGEYRKAENNMVYSTTEFKDYLHSPIILFDRTSGNSQIAAFTTWSGDNENTIKNLRESRKEFAKIKTSRVCYVWLPQNGYIAQMNLGNRDYNGCDHSGNVDYNSDPIEGSFGHFLHMANKHMRGAPFGVKCKLSTRAFNIVDDDGEEKDDFAKMFTISEPLDPVSHPWISTPEGKVSQAITALNEYLVDRLENNISYAMKNTDDSTIIVDMPARLTALKQPYELAQVLLGLVKTKKQAPVLQSGGGSVPIAAPKKKKEDEDVDVVEAAGEVFAPETGSKTEYKGRVTELNKMKKPQLQEIYDGYELKGAKTMDELKTAILEHEFKDSGIASDGEKKALDNVFNRKKEEKPNKEEVKDETLAYHESATRETSSDKMIKLIADVKSKSELKKLFMTVLDGVTDETVIAAYDKKAAELEKKGGDEGNEVDPW